ncbi:50S ribosomal protein L22 [Candidatus Woesebacteria bacterium RIFCSPHIGHO2_01_FULL_39_32]|uniref:Large ribosomal subunit protein uL22 n=2 Tax=Candidatus Woeseibacteriota TaxID=1752722 RepID=A0A0G0PQ63_9BACT|nr:MAG: 50S ribosomal protein L22 [Candidatus Woesebacteria bacterium GW2011_GWA1_39_8]OGM04924.1 MAG: 50S ribosomal protein L22 [Candidatus Woesebacteria bacterium GWB1_37_5]OGM24731.1 MAG: 50S ribosomal protein L22 [Candidatus Woesebacteria bacterium RIFCSPHIGHO2_01_FULL_39_32]OGM64557.1 MAG: 50S ribosomal protein L22 [Candidatus Woesebacteria bacterium RIFCSPLOWO2_01_FULL_39_25]
MEFKATQKFVLSSPKKLREVVALIKKLSPTGAVERLPFAGKRAAKPLEKVVKTAIANAKQKEVNVETLIFKEIQIGEGPRLKRFRAGARGRAKPYKRRMSHIRVVLTTRNDQISKSKSQTNSKIVNLKEEKKDVKIPKAKLRRNKNV